MHVSNSETPIRRLSDPRGVHLQRADGAEVKRVGGGEGCARAGMVECDSHPPRQRRRRMRACWRPGHATRRP
jgi:hypothetical protein